MEIETSATPVASGARGPSSDFVKRRHERMNTRRGGSTTEELPDSGGSKTPQLTVDVTDDALEETNMNNSAKLAFSTASPTAIRSFRQLRAKRKNRVPGGAAAKLIGKANDEDAIKPNNKEEDKDDIEEVPKVPEDEFIRMRDEAKVAFEKGPRDNRRYHADSTVPHQSNSNDKEACHHSRILSREQVLHENPTAAVLSLLGGTKEPPRSPPNISRHAEIMHSCSREPQAPPKDFTQTPAMEITPRNAFQAPPRKDDSCNGSKGNFMVGSNLLDPSEEMETTTKGKNPLEQPLLSKKAERRVAQMNEKMKDPNATLAELISNIATPEDHSPGDSFPRGYMVRRKNACGALQVMTAKNIHRVQICWTLGVLSALSSVLEDSGTRDLAVEFPDVPTRKEFIEARKRAVGSLMNLSMPPQNRLAVFHTPRLVANVVRVITLDHNDAGKGCCAVLAHLAKSKENRLLMVQVPGLIDAITAVIEPKVIIVPSKTYEDEQEEVDYDSFESQDYDSPSRDSSSEDGSTAGPLSSGSFSSMEEEERRRETHEERRYAVDVTAVPTHDPAKAARRYDKDPNKHLQGARVNIFALLTHLVKEKDNAVSFLLPHLRRTSLYVSHLLPYFRHCCIVYPRQAQVLG